MLVSALQSLWSRASASTFQRLGAGLCLLALLPGLTSRWAHSQGGVAEEIWSLGVPGSPIVTLHRVGAGPIDAVAWDGPTVRFQPVSVSAAVFVMSLGCFLIARRRLLEERARSSGAAAHG